MNRDAKVSDMIRLQREFDSRHASAGRRWNDKINETNLNVLLELTVALAGELGELANVAKSVARGDYTLESARDRLSEELADIFIYVLKLSDQLDIDLVSAFDKKLQVNADRFRNYELPGSHG